MNYKTMSHKGKMFDKDMEYLKDKNVYAAAIKEHPIIFILLIIDLVVLVIGGANLIGRLLLLAGFAILAIIFGGYMSRKIPVDSVTLVEEENHPHSGSI